MTTEQTAINFCVPMPETCQALNWKGETLFYWIKHKEWKEWHIKFYKEIQTTLLEYKGQYEVIPVPNAQKLFEALPKIIYDMYNGSSYEWYFAIVKSEIYYLNDDLEISNPNFRVKIQDNLTQAIAELYILLKEKGLLKTT